MTLNFIFIGSSGGLFIHIKQSAAGASLKSPSYDWSHLLLSERPCVEMCVRRWIWGRIGCNRSRVKNIADGNKRSSYVFLAVWISLQCNFSGKSFCLFLISAVSSAVCIHARNLFRRKCFLAFFYASLIVRRLSWEGERAVCHYWQLSACGALAVKPNIDTRTSVSNYTELWMNSRVFSWWQ